MGVCCGTKEDLRFRRYERELEPLEPTLSSYNFFEETLPVVKENKKIESFREVLLSP